MPFWTVEDACPYNFGLSKHPYENSRKVVLLVGGEAHKRCAKLGKNVKKVRK